MPLVSSSLSGAVAAGVSRFCPRYQYFMRRVLHGRSTTEHNFGNPFKMRPCDSNILVVELCFLGGGVILTTILTALIAFTIFILTFMSEDLRKFLEGYHTNL